MPGGVRFQPVDARDVAERLAELALGEPKGLVPDLVGPKVYSVAELARDYTPALGQNLEEARWCAGSIAGFLAALFRVPCVIEDRLLAHALARVERSAP